MSETTYRESGVDMCAGDQFVNSIKSLAKKTHNASVLSGIGGFSSLFHLDRETYRNPVLVSGTDGVGTKLKLSVAYDGHDWIGVDLVAMCVNDVLVQGAKPLFFLDYFSCSVLNQDVAHRVVSGIALGCQEASCALVGGETAEMPGVYHDQEYDLAGFCVGVVEKVEMMDSSSVQAGDQVIGLASSGIHSNGYSLVRCVIEKNHIDVKRKFFDGPEQTLLEVLLKPTRIYVSSVLTVLHHSLSIHAMAHITGGGLPGNIARVLPSGLQVQLRRNAWPVPPVFEWLQKCGSIHSDEMFRVFNNGIGFVLIAPPSSCPSLLKQLKECGETPFLIGEVVSAPEAKEVVTVV